MKVPMERAEPTGAVPERHVAIVESVGLMPAIKDDYVLLVTDRRLILVLSKAERGAEPSGMGISREAPEELAARKGSLSIGFADILRMTMKRQRKGGDAHLMIRFRRSNRKEQTVRLGIKSSSDVVERAADGSSWLSKPASTVEHVQDLLHRRLPPGLQGISTWAA